MTELTVVSVDGEAVSKEVEEFGEWVVTKLIPLLNERGSKDFDAYYHTFAALAAVMISRNGMTPQAVGDFAYDRATAQQEFLNATRGDLN